MPVPSTPGVSDQPAKVMPAQVGVGRSTVPACQCAKIVAAEANVVLRTSSVAAPVASIRGRPPSRELKKPSNWKGTSTDVGPLIVGVAVSDGSCSSKVTLRVCAAGTEIRAPSAIMAPE